MNNILDAIIINLATLGPFGKKFPAPGTVGSLIGFLIFGLLLLSAKFSISSIILASIPLILIGIPICTRAEIILEIEDPKSVIWDEFSTIPLVFLFFDESSLENSLIQSIGWLTLGFLLFRFFDIAKPLGIRKLQILPKGLGVMVDDIAAAIASATILWLIQTFPLSFF